MTSTITDRRIGVYGSAGFKIPVRVSTTVNIDLHSLITVDGVSLVDGDRVLVKDQTNTVENGIYVASTGMWRRASDFNGVNDIVRGTLVSVTGGNTNNATLYEVTTADPIVIGTTGITFGVFAPLSSGEIVVVGSGSGATDTAAVNAAVAQAVALGRRMIKLRGNIRLKGASTSNWNWINDPTQPVHVSVQIASNLHFLGENCTLTFEQPAIAYTTEYIFALFGTGYNPTPGTIENVTFENITIDFSNAVGAEVPNQTYGFFFSGVRNPVFRHVTWLCSSRTATATMTIGNPAVVTIPSHGLMVRSSVVFSTTGTLPTGLRAGVRYWVAQNNITNNTFRVTDVYDGGAMQTSGSQSGVHTATMVTRYGAPINLENCHNPVFDHCRTFSCRQGYYGHYVHNLNVDDFSVEDVAEGLDMDGPHFGGNFNNLSFKDLWNEAQCLDISTISDSNWNNIKADGVAQVLQLYNKRKSYKGKGTRSGYELWHQYELAASPTLTIASPCVVTWPAHGLSNGDIINFDDGTDTLPTGLATNTDYYLINKTDDTFQLSATTGGTAINTSGSQSGTHSAYYVQKDIVIVPVTMTIATPCVVTWTAHGLYSGDTIYFKDNGDTLPTGLSFWTTYYVASKTADTFRLTATYGGSAINTTGSQSGTHIAAHVATDFPQSGVTISLATPAVLTLADHGFVDGDVVYFKDNGDTLPAAFTFYDRYYVTHYHKDDFGLALTTNGDRISTAAMSQSGTHVIAKEGNYQSEICSNNHFRNIVGKNLRKTSDPTIMLGNQRNNNPSSSRQQWRNGMTAQQNEGLTLESIKLDGGSLVLVEEGRNISITDMLLQNFDPGTTAGYDAALVVRQSTSGSYARYESALTNCYLKRITVENSRGKGIILDSASEALDATDLVVDGFNLQRAATSAGIFVRRPDLKGGSFFLGNLQSRGGKVGATSLYDLQMDDSVVGDSTYRFSLAGPLSLRSTGTGVMNAHISVGSTVREQARHIIASVNTGSVSPSRHLISWQNTTYARVLYAGLMSPTDIAAQATDYSNARLKRQRAGSTFANISNLLRVEDASVTRAGGTIQAFTIDQDDATNTVIAPGDAIILELALGGGTGSVTPANYTLVIVIAEYSM